MVKYFKKNKNGKIEFTETELKKILDEVYNAGYDDCKSRCYVYTTPYRWYDYPYYTYTTTASNSGISLGNTTTTAKTISTPTTNGTITINGYNNSSKTKVDKDTFKYVAETLADKYEK